MKKLVSMMMVLIMAFGIICMPTQGEEVKAATYTISKTKATIKVGKTLKLKVAGTKATTVIVWKSSKKSVAKVSAAGKVTAKKAGTATITATIGKKAVKCKVTVKKPAVVTTQATTFKDMQAKDIIAKIGPSFTEDQKKSGVLASISLAQFCLESGYGKSELAQNANNCFGMKTSLSGNTWAGSTWDGISIYTKKTGEETKSGKKITITADFRKYPCIEDSIADHSAYLLGAKNGTKLRYQGLKGEKDYKKAIKIIKDGGYATSSSYVNSIISIIERYDLTQYDVK